MRKLVILMLVFAVRAEAEVCKVKEDALVFRPSTYEQFVTLMESGRSEDAAQCCLSCTVDVGHKVEIKEKGSFTHVVKVLDGPSKNCVGEVSSGMLTCK